MVNASCIVGSKLRRLRTLNFKVLVKPLVIQPYLNTNLPCPFETPPKRTLRSFMKDYSFRLQPAHHSGQGPVGLWASNLPRACLDISAVCSNSNGRDLDCVRAVFFGILNQAPRAQMNFVVCTKTVFQWIPEANARPTRRGK